MPGVKKTIEDILEEMENEQVKLAEDAPNILHLTMDKLTSHEAYKKGYYRCLAYFKVQLRQFLKEK